MDRIWLKIDARGPCWEWTDKPSQYGYGRIFYERRTWLAHRLVWTILVGPIPEGMTLDHVCRNRICVNPDHLEVVTLAENKRRGRGPSAVNLRKTHCKYGHPFTEESIRGDGTGRRCRVCARKGW